MSGLVGSSSHRVFGCHLMSLIMQQLLREMLLLAELGIHTLIHMDIKLAISCLHSFSEVHRIYIIVIHNQYWNELPELFVTKQFMIPDVDKVIP